MIIKRGFGMSAKRSLHREYLDAVWNQRGLSLVQNDLLMSLCLKLQPSATPIIAAC